MRFQFRHGGRSWGQGDGEVQTRWMCGGREGSADELAPPKLRQLKTNDLAGRPKANSDTWRNTALNHGVWKHFLLHFLPLWLSLLYTYTCFNTNTLIHFLIHADILVHFRWEKGFSTIFLFITTFFVNYDLNLQVKKKVQSCNDLELLNYEIIITNKQRHYKKKYYLCCNWFKTRNHNQQFQ